MNDYPKKMLWTQFQIAQEIGKHRNDSEWNPHEVRIGEKVLFVVRKLNGELVPPPQPTTIT